MSGKGLCRHIFLWSYMNVCSPVDLIVEKGVPMKGVTVRETPACSCGDVCTMASRRVFRVEGMDCAHESGPILSALSSLPGVGRAVPSYSDSTLTVEFDPHAVSAERIVQAIDEAGFRANIEARRQEDIPFWQRHGRLVATSLSGGSLVVGLILQLLLGRLSAAKPFLLLAAVAGGWYVSRRAWQAVRHRQLEMNTLMTVAAVGALLIGEWADRRCSSFRWPNCWRPGAWTAPATRSGASSTFPPRRPL